VLILAHVPTDPAAWLAQLSRAEVVPAVIVDHLGACHDRGMTPATLATKLTVLRRIDAQLAERGTTLLDADEPAVRAWWRALRSHGLAETTRARNLSLLRSFYRWAIREELRDTDPSWRLDGPRLTVRTPRPADADAIRELLARLHGSRDWLPVALAAYCGLRCAEIAGLRVGDLTHDEQGWALLVRGKGKYERSVNAPPALAEALEGQNRRWAAVRTPAGTSYTPGGISRLIGRVLRRYDVPASAHQLRHLYGTRFHRLSGDLLATQRALGHRSPSATAIYAQADPAAIRATAEQVWAELGASPEGEKRATPPEMPGQTAIAVEQPFDTLENLEAP
jgi:site-specific recombinase XerD